MFTPSYSFDIPTLKIFCDATVDEILLDGDYTIHGKVLVAPIEGEGRFTAKIGKYGLYLLDHQFISKILNYCE